MAVRAGTGWWFAAVSAAATLATAPAGAQEADVGSPPGVEPTSESSWDVPGWVIIDAEDGLGSSGLDALEAELAPSFAGIELVPTDLAHDTSAVIARVGPGAERRLLDALSGDARIERLEPLAWVRSSFVPDDPLYGDQWHMKRVGAERAWDFATGRGVTVAVVDTGIACEDHPPFMKGTDLRQTTCVGGWNLVANHEHANDDQGHGTHVAGTIAQSTDNALGATGLAFHAELMPVKVLNHLGWGTTADVADGIRWAADHGAHVINLSLGGPRNSAVIESAVAHARSRGAVVVAAAGNSGGSVGYPGGSTGVIGVSATDPGDKIARFSSRGKGVDVAAPGVAVVQQTICESGRNQCEIFPGYNGTSMASPHVAAAAALLVSQGLSDPDAVEAALTGTARQVEGGTRAELGAGILDAAAAVRTLATRQALWRLGLVAAFTWWVASSARKKHGQRHPLGLGYLLGALLAGPGLFFFAPLLLSREALVIDVLARPLGDLDLLVGASLHRFLPLAHVGVPLAVLVLTWQLVRLRPAVAGLAVGTAAYLGATVAVGGAWMPFGATVGALWCAAHAIACLFLARLCLGETRA